VGSRVIGFWLFFKREGEHRTSNIERRTLKWEEFEEAASSVIHHQRSTIHDPSSFAFIRGLKSLQKNRRCEAASPYLKLKPKKDRAILQRRGLIFCSN
jgi:hypothetical protein